MWETIHPMVSQKPNRRFGRLLVSKNFASLLTCNNGLCRLIYLILSIKNVYITCFRNRVWLYNIKWGKTLKNEFCDVLEYILRSSLRCFARTCDLSGSSLAASKVILYCAMYERSQIKKRVCYSSQRAKILTSIWASEWGFYFEMCMKRLFHVPKLKRESNELFW